MSTASDDPIIRIRRSELTAAVDDHVRRKLQAATKAATAEAAKMRKATVLSLAEHDRAWEAAFRKAIVEDIVPLVDDLTDRIEVVRAHAEAATDPSDRTIERARAAKMARAERLERQADALEDADVAAGLRQRARELRGGDGE